MTISRRTFLRLSAISAIGGLAAACSKRAPASGLAPEVIMTAPAPVTLAGEPPLLRDRVSAGALPPVQERLPANPLLLEPHDTPGVYGGVLRRGFVTETGNIYQDMRHGQPGQYTAPFFVQGLTAYTPGLSLRPNVCEAWEVSDDARICTYHLRKGLRWSDGHPVTSVDAGFYHEQIVHPRLGSVLGGATRDVPGISTPDDFTVEFHFGQPNPFHPHEMTSDLPLQPAHYLSHWHGDHADPAALSQAAQAQGLRSWEGLFLIKSHWAGNPELPVLHTWVLAGDPRGTEIVLERNPFFFQIDTQGQQLPYLDQVILARYDTQSALLQDLQEGALDLHTETLTPADTGYLESTCGEVGHALIPLPSSWHLVLEPNVAYQDEPLRAFLSDRQVREALALAVDREAINTFCYDGRCRPRQYSPVRASPQYDQALANSHVAYDPIAAATLLDEAGYAERDAEGWRTAAGGQELSLRIATTSSEGAPAEQAAQLAAGFLQDVGLDCRVERLNHLDYIRRSLANRIQIALTERDHMLLPIVAEHKRLLAVGDMRDAWAGAYLHHRLYGTDHPDYTAIEPPEGHWIRAYWALWDEIGITVDEEERDALYAEVLALWRTEIPVIGLLGEAPQPLVVSANLRNVRTDLPYDLQTGGLALLAPQQLYWEPREYRAVPTPTGGSLSRKE